MANPQLENGYTRIANEILEEVTKLPLNGTQFRIVIAIWRYTYGFQRKEHELSQTFISEATGLHKKQIQRELNKLIEMNIIHVVKEASFSSARVLKFNKYHSSWEVTNQLPGNQTDTHTGSELTPSPGSGLAPQERQYKDNIKDITPLPPQRGDGGDDDFKLNENEAEAKEVGAVFEFYQNNFGVISPIIADKIGAMVEEIGPAMVVEALKIAALNRARSIRYIEPIIRNWLDHNIRDPSQIEAFNRERNSTPPKPEIQKPKEVSESDISTAATYIEMELNEFKKKRPSIQQMKAFLNSNKFLYSEEIKRKAFDRLGLIKFLEGG